MRRTHSGAGDCFACAIGRCDRDRRERERERERDRDRVDAERDEGDEGNKGTSIAIFAGELVVRLDSTVPSVGYPYV